MSSLISTEGAAPPWVTSAGRRNPNDGRGSNPADFFGPTWSGRANSGAPAYEPEIRRMLRPMTSSRLVEDADPLARVGRHSSSKAAHRAGHLRRGV